MIDLPMSRKYLRERRMSKTEMRLLFDLAEKLYEQERKKSGTSTLPYAWAKCGESFLAISLFGVHSKTVESKLREII